MAGERPPAVPVIPADAPILEIRRRPDLSGQLKDVLEPLGRPGFPITEWTPTAIARSYVSVKTFISSVRFVTSISPRDVLDTVLAHGVARGFWVQNYSCRPEQFYKYSQWLKTPEGRAYVNSCQKRAKLEKRSIPGQSIADTALVLALTQQLTDLAAKRKGRCAELEAEIRDLHRLIVIRTAELEHETAEVESSFLPSQSTFDPEIFKERMKKRKSSSDAPPTGPSLSTALNLGSRAPNDPLPPSRPAKKSSSHEPI